MFENDLEGFGVAPTETYRYLDCNEVKGQNKLSDSSGTN